MADLTEIVEALNRYLRIDEVPDFPGAHNGLQVESRSPVERVACATDGTLATIEMARDAGAQLLVAHHGILWGGLGAIVGPTYRRLRTLIEADIALYAAHLPLDAHEEVGNNVLLARALDVEVEGRFGEVQGIEGLGVWSAVDLPLEGLLDRIGEVCGADPTVIRGGPTHVRRLGIVTGGGGSLVPQAHEAGLDTLLTGEGKHHTYPEAMELGLNVVYAGHYATETFGVKAVGEWLTGRFGVDWEFLDDPTGL